MCHCEIDSPENDPRATQHSEESLKKAQLLLAPFVWVPVFT
jgi:hypothetical protein